MVPVSSASNERAVARGPRQLASGRQLAEHLAQTALRVEIRVRRRRAVHDHGAATERLDLVARAVKQRRALLHDVVFCRRQSKSKWENQPLRHRAIAVESVHELFEQNTFVRGVLIDDQQSAAHPR